VTAEDLVYPVLGHIVIFICVMAIPLLGLSMLHMIGRHD